MEESIIQYFKRDKRLRRVNYAIVVLICVINVYTLILPFIPSITFWFAQKGSSLIPSGSNLAGASGVSDSKGPNLGNLSGDKLIIPSIGLSETVHTGDSEKTVNLGPWMRPNTSTPDRGSNTVIVGHRFSYQSPSVFYHLDKMKQGDRFLVYWQGKEYDYEVTETKVVRKTQVEIESPSKGPILTLYTCTPIWTAKDRLVVVAKLIYTNNDTPKVEAS